MIETTSLPIDEVNDCPVTSTETSIDATAAPMLEDKLEPVTRFPTCPHSLKPQVFAPQPLLSRSIVDDQTDNKDAIPVTGSVVLSSIVSLPTLNVDAIPVTAIV